MLSKTARLIRILWSPFPPILGGIRKQMASCVALDAEADQNKTASATDRILRWVETGKHTFETDHVECQSILSTIETEKVPDGADGKAISTSSEHMVEASSDGHQSQSTDKHTSTINSESALTDGSSERKSPNKLLTGHNNDPLRPNTEQISYTFLRGERIWSSYFTHAKSLPSGWMPEGWFAPYTLTHNIPPLPQDLPRRKCIVGQALWHVPHPELHQSCQQDVKMAQEDDPWNPELIYNFPKEFFLATQKPLECGICSRRCHGDEEPDGIAILTICWAYMFTVRFLEMQKRTIRYSSTRLTPVLSAASRLGPVMLSCTSSLRRGI